MVSAAVLREKRIRELRDWVKTSMSELVQKTVEAMGPDPVRRVPRNVDNSDTSPRTGFIQRIIEQQAVDRWLVTESTAENYAELALRPYKEDLRRGIITTWNQKYESRK